MIILYIIIDIMDINDNRLEILRNAEQDNYPLFSLKGIITYAKILSNYDGDTADCLLLHKNNLILING